MGGKFHYGFVLTIASTGSMAVSLCTPSLLEEAGLLQQAGGAERDRDGPGARTGEEETVVKLFSYSYKSYN